MGYTLKNIKYNPIKGYDYSYITSKFGKRTFYNGITKKYETGFHNGIDMTTGKTVVATSKGKVVEVEKNIAGYSEKHPLGNYVKLYHGNGVYTLYSHLKNGSVKVDKDDIINMQGVIGEIGSTGHSTGPHLHYGIYINRSWVDPEDYLIGGKNLPSYEAEKEDFLIYTIKSGDTLIGIANAHGTDYKTLAEINDIKNANLIYVGDEIKIPLKTQKTYTVVKGDTLSSIAQKYNTTWQIIYGKNKEIIGEDPNLIRIGTKLFI